MSPNNRPPAGAHILTPGQMKIRRTTSAAYAQPFKYELQAGPSQVDQQISYGMTKIEYAAALIAGQVAGEYAAGLINAEMLNIDTPSDRDYIAGVARLATDLASAVLAECRKRTEAPPNDKRDGRRDEAADHPDPGDEKPAAEGGGTVAA